MFIGCDALQPFKIVQNFDADTVSSASAEIAMQPPPAPASVPGQCAHNDHHDKLLSDVFCDTSKTINETAHGRTNVEDVIKSLSYLPEDQRSSSSNLVIQFPDLFGGKLRKFTDYEVSLEPKPDAKPHAS